MIRSELLFLMMVLLVSVMTLAFAAVFVLPNPTTMLVGLLSIPVGCAARVTAACKRQRA